MPRARGRREGWGPSRPAGAQASQGVVSFWHEWDGAAAEAALRRAIELDPSYDFAHRMLGVVLAHTGRHGESGPALRRARELEPLNPLNHALSSHGAFLAGDYPAAVSLARQAIVIDPDFWIGHYLLAQVAERLGETELALEELGHAARLSGGNSKALSLRGYLMARRGRTEEARAVLGALEDAARVRYLPPYAMALVHAGLGEHDASFAWLDRAHEVRDVHVVYLPVDPKWDPLRSDARFPALLGRCGLAGRSVPAR
jgi:tetratricopeptide (TPR) repeat protein